MERSKSSSSVIRDFRLTAVRFVADAVNRTLDLREISDNALDAVLAVTHMDAGAMYRWVEEDAALHLYAWRSLTEAFTRQVMVIRRGDDALIDAVLEGTTRVVGDFTVTLKSVGQGEVRAGFGGAVLCPILAQGKMVGLLVLGAYRQRRFESETLDLIEVIANQIGIGITNAELVQDVQRKNELLRLLMEEAHHRIKNNLQMISGLLQLELAASEGRTAERLEHAISQVQAIAQVHNLLSAEMPEQVDARVLIRVIVETLVSSATGEPPRVQMNLEQLWLNADQAVPLALIINELVTNSLLHGVPPEGEPLQLFVFCQHQNNTVTITIADNGGGFRATETRGRSSGQGVNIIRQLTQVNLRGELLLGNSDVGVCATLRFPLEGGTPGA